MSVREYNRGLARVQRDLPTITHDKDTRDVTRGGGSWGYTYASLNHIEKLVRPVLSKHGFSYSFDVEVKDGQIKTTCKLLHEDGHHETSSFEAPIDSGGKKSAIQQVGSSRSYGMRYALCQILGISTTDEDTDGQPPETGEVINDEQFATLSALMDEVQPDMAKFCGYFGIKEMSEMLASRYAEAVDLLERKR